MKYENGKIYKIVSDHSDKMYIGSTCSYLSKRLYEHKCDYNRFKEGNYPRITSFELIELGDIDIVLIENYPCKDKNELHARERYWIELNREIAVNRNIPTRTRNEYAHQYYKENKEKLQDYQKHYTLAHHEEIKIKKGEYYNNNKETLLEYHRQYNIKNKEGISGRKAIKALCECGSYLRKSDFAQHQRSQKHQSYMKQQDKINIEEVDFQLLFKMDSLMLLPKAYTNINITKEYNENN